MNLQGLHVLITRPRGRGETLAAAIQAAGGHVREVPLLAVEPLDPQADAAIRATTETRLRQLDRYDAVIAISINAVQFGLQWASEFWPQWPPQLRWFGIGAATAEALAAWGTSATAPAHGMNTEALLALPVLQQIEGWRFLILRGVGGRETLAAQLRARGAVVDYAECYRRVAPVLDTETRVRLSAPVDAICVNSAETLANLWNNLSGNNLRCNSLPPDAAARVLAQALIVPSARVADRAAELGFSRVVVAANAGTAATLAALQSLLDS